MNWLFGSKGSNNPSILATTPLQQQRLKQIKSLSNHNQNVSEVKRDVDYKVSFLINGINFALYIHLPPQFPNEKPFVVMHPKVYHPWVDTETMEIKGSTALATFYMHSDLGKVIQQIVKEFRKHPPAIASIADFEYPAVPTGFPGSSFQMPYSNFADATTAENTATTDGSSDRPPSYGSSHKTVGEISADDEVGVLLKDIATLQKSALEKICNDPDVLIDRVLKMRAIEKLQEDRKKYIEQNEELAGASLALEPVIDDLKGELKETFEEYNELYYAFQEKSRQQDELSQIYDFGNILTNLRIGVMQSEEESEKVAEDFIAGSIGLDTFISDYLEKRKGYHLRRSQEERIKCLAPPY